MSSGKWYADLGTIRGGPPQPRCDDGELVEFTLSWEEAGVPHTCHQAHVIRLAGRSGLASDTVFCGGRWPEPLVAQMPRRVG